MNFLLDTNVVSEWAKQRPDPGVIGWLEDVDEDRTFLSVVTLAELRHGVERLPDSKRRRHLDAWLKEDLVLRFENRVLPVDERVAESWGRLVVRSETAGRPIGVMDAFIGATATVHALTLVTRNESDFQAAVSRILNPWAG